MDTQKVLELASKQIEQAFGKGSVMRLGQKSSQKIDVISTGSIGLDAAIGVGGLPCGRITEIYGPESSGKTTLALHVVAEAQKKGTVCVFIDAEHALDSYYVSRLGVSADELLVSQPDFGEQALEVVGSFIRSEGIGVVVVDSVAALIPKAELEGRMTDSYVGVQARLMSQGLRKLTATISSSKTRCMVIFINQLRQRIGFVLGSSETTAGGNALKFYASVRLDIRRIGVIKNREEIIGNQTRVRVVKNKVAPPFRVAEFDILYGVGISKLGEILDLGTKVGLVSRLGSWYSYKDQKIGHGREEAMSFLKQNYSIKEELEQAVVSNLASSHGKLYNGAYPKDQ